MPENEADVLLYRQLLKKEHGLFVTATCMAGKQRVVLYHSSQSVDLSCTWQRHWESALNNAAMVQTLLDLVAETLSASALYSLSCVKVMYS